MEESITDSLLNFSVSDCEEYKVDWGEEEKLSLKKEEEEKQIWKEGRDREIPILKKCDGCELISQFKEDLMHIADKTGVRIGTAQKYLLKFKNNRNKAVQFIQDHYYYDVGQNKMSSINECLSCLSPFPISEIEIFDCDHFLCKDCFKCYVKTEIEQGPNCIFMRCPQEGCNENLSYELIAKYAKNREIQFFEKFLINKIVLSSKNLHFCPWPYCGKIIKQINGSDNDGVKDIICCYEECKFNFCSICKLGSHMPLTCDLNAKWLNQVSNVNENSFQYWTKLHTKSCPVCKISIEKTEGCMHITCGFCGHEFCWLCLDIWKEHGEKTDGTLSCNFYKGDQARSQTLKELDKEFARFLFFSERFAQHKNSVKLSEAIYLNKLKSFDHLPLASDLPIYIKCKEIFENSLQIVIKTRRMIANTYPIAFYIKNDAKRKFFQFLQNEVEYQLEKLDKLCNKDLEITSDSHQNLPDHFYRIEELSGIFLKYSKKIIDYLKNNLPDFKDNSENRKLSSDEPEVDLFGIFLTWNCTACTFTNEILDCFCFMCETPKPEDE